MVSLRHVVLSVAAFMAAQAVAQPEACVPNQCCARVAGVQDDGVKTLLDSLNIDIEGQQWGVGIQCSPNLDICESEYACCNGETIAELVTLNCRPAIPSN
ncbi:hypothetical protein FQN54_007518 [Arachnomyces sp. PD_36]|nr:hypothetical protein FQN54_007518 [Arachnomyces sp. PD_36]